MKNSVRVVLFGLATLTSAQAIADVWFVPRVEYSFTQYKQSLVAQEAGDDVSDGGSTTTTEDNVNLNLMTIGGGATFGIDAFYIDVDVKQTADSELHGFYDDQFTSNSFNIKDNGSVDRSELSVTSGFGFEHFSLFGGLKITSTEFGHALYFDQVSDDGTFPAFTVANEGGSQVPIVTKTNFDSTGVFGGISVQLTFGESGALALSAAYSQILEATLEDDWFNSEQKYDLKGTGNGLSAAAKLSYGWFYAKAEYAKYDYKDYEKQGDTGADFSEQVTEQFLRLGGGISILF